MYFVPSLKKHCNFKYPPNILKILLLNYFTSKNLQVAKEYGLLTNDFLIGVGYTGLMDNLTIEYGLKALEGDCVAEALIHPCHYATSNKNQHCTEFLITQNKELKDKISRLGFELTNYKKEFLQNNTKENNTDEITITAEGIKKSINDDITDEVIDYETISLYKSQINKFPEERDELNKLLDKKLFEIIDKKIKNIDNKIVKNWLIIVESVNDIAFNCALNNWNNKALIATGIIKTKIAKKYFTGI